MKQINLWDIKVFPITKSARRLKISDEEYFGERYSKYISNSSMGAILNGMNAYYGPKEHIVSPSLALGSAVHTQLLEPEEFTLAGPCFKPTAKLGLTMDYIKENRRKGLSIYDSIVVACKKADYYVNSIDKHIPDIILKGFKYYWTTKDWDDSIITLDDKSLRIAENCIANLKANREIMSKLHPVDVFGNEVSSYNEDTLFLDYVIEYQGNATILNVKGKLDNWTIDDFDKIITLNDLKTSSHLIQYFMHKEFGSFFKYHYYRQVFLYKQMLEAFAIKNCGYDRNDWDFNCNILAVQTTEDNPTRCISIADKYLKQGQEELYKCLKMIGYYEIFGHETEVKFV